MTRHDVGLLVPLGLLGVILAGGCTVGTSREDSQRAAAREPAGTSACFYRRQVSDFRVLDRSNLIVYAPSKSNAYQVQISPSSTELKFADAIAFSSRRNRICGYAGDRLIIGSGPSPREYSVSGVYRLDEVGLQRLLELHGIGKPGEPLEPEETEGAEIERDIDPAEESKDQ